jgi:hypothetical protein
MRKLFNATLFIILLAAGVFAQGTSAASPTLKVGDGTRSFNGVNELRVPAGCVTFSGRTAIINCTAGNSAGTTGSQNGNLFFASPNGAYGLPSWRAIFEADLPSISQSKVTNLVSDLGAKQASDSDLTAVAGLSSTGLVARTGAGVAATRTITGTTNQVTVTNGNGVSGNPTLSLPQSIATTSGVQFDTLGLNTSTPNVLNGSTFPSTRFQAYNATNSTYFAVNTALPGGYAGAFFNRAAANANERLWAMEAQPFNSNTSSIFGISKYNDAGTPTGLFNITRTSNVIVGEWTVLPTTATEGFLHIPTTAGTPTGTPLLFPGKSPLVIDSVNDKLCYYIAAWRCI